MSYMPGRDSNGAGEGAFAFNPDVADSHQAAFAESFAPPTDQLSEQDYRPAEMGGTSQIPDLTDDITVGQQPPMKPGDKAYPTPRPGGFVNL